MIGKKKSVSEKCLESMYAELDKMGDRTTPEAMRLTESTQNLEKAKHEKPSLSPDAILAAVSSLGGIVLILLAESEGTYLSGTKAWSQLMKIKH